MIQTFEQSLSTTQVNLGIQDGGDLKLDPIAFTVSNFTNQDGEGLGSLTILYHAAIHGQTVKQALRRFGEYAALVANDPSGQDHPNIRALTACNPEAKVSDVVDFSGIPITRKSPQEKFIETAWEGRTKLGTFDPEELRTSVEVVIDHLDAGRLRVAEQLGVGRWWVHQWIKKAVLLSFRLNDNQVMQSGDLSFFDKVATKFSRMDAAAIRASGVRVVPPAVARRGSFLGKGVVLMPSYVNIGAYVDEGTMVDTWATVGSCAQIGKNVHLSGGVGIGGVLEPLQANPTIIEDNCFIGARSEVVEGVIVEENSVLGMGVYLGQSTPIFNRETGEISFGRVPSGSVVVSGNLPKKAANGADYSMYAAIIVKRVDAQTRSKTSINDLLRP